MIGTVELEYQAFTDEPVDTVSGNPHLLAHVYSGRREAKTWQRFDPRVRELAHGSGDTGKCSRSHMQAPQFGSRDMPRADSRVRYNQCALKALALGHTDEHIDNRVHDGVP
ncbi:hypothetical protein [Microbacterium sp. MPKO10]|uniref:hypothetical protein n=1 Tax=Microbacterium sp. MPKO10 TaxID=2989818 RepID=UPI002235635E|nr:hypothetical protein [Microbacterium sp. MPKO10]MCW4458581.1 hypothetical protein [Microbacterium sp. MPKO10]